MMIASEEFQLDGPPPNLQQGSMVVGSRMSNGAEAFTNPDVMPAPVMGAHFKQEIDPMMMDMGTVGVPGGPDVQGVPEYPWMKEKKTSRKQHRGESNRV